LEEGDVPENMMRCLNLIGKPLLTAPPSEFLSKFIEFVRQNGLFERVEVDGDAILLYHRYRNPKTVSKLAKWISILLNLGTGYKYAFSSPYNTIILKKIG